MYRFMAVSQSLDTDDPLCTALVLEFKEAFSLFDKGELTRHRRHRDYRGYASPTNVHLTS